MEGALVSAAVTAILSPIALVVLAAASLVASGLRWRKLLGLMRRTTRHESRRDHPLARVRAFFVYVVRKSLVQFSPFFISSRNVNLSAVGFS